MNYYQKYVNISMDWDISDNGEKYILFNAFFNSIVLLSMEIRGNMLSEITELLHVFWVKNDSHKAAVSNLLSQLIDLYE